MLYKCNINNLILQIAMKLPMNILFLKAYIVAVVCISTKG